MRVGMCVCLCVSGISLAQQPERYLLPPGLSSLFLPLCVALSSVSVDPLIFMVLHKNEQKHDYKDSKIM